MTAAVVCCLGLLAVASGDPAPLSSCFSDEPPDALIRRCRPAGPDLPVGLKAHRQCRWLERLRLLRIDTTLTNVGDSAACVPRVSIGRWVFRTAGVHEATDYRELTYRNEVWYGSTYWSGPDWTRVGSQWHHPGENTPSVRRLTVPQDGLITIKGRAYKLDTNNGGGDGVRLSIEHGRRTVWTAEIDGSDTNGVEPDISLTVRRGDAVRFVVHKRGHIYHDTTHWDPVVAYATGSTLRASEGFSTSRQGAGGWFYEMRVDPRPELGPPQIHGFDRDLALRQRSVDVGRPVCWTSRDTLPLAVVADGRNRSGIVLAVCGTGPWQLVGNLAPEGQLEVKVVVDRQKTPCKLQPGESVTLPAVLMGAYRGAWPVGMSALARALQSRTSEVSFENLGQQLALAELAGVDRRAIDLWAMVQAEWNRQDRLDGSDKAYAAAAARHLQKARQLVDDLRAGQPRGFLAAEADQLRQLAAVHAAAAAGPRRLYQQVRRLKRRIVLANPLLKFGKLLFTKRVPTSYSHLVMQYFGWRARPGGGIFVLDNPGRSLACRDILDGRLAGGNVLEPRLSYDARRIVFSYVEADRQRDPTALANDVDAGFYHIFEVNVDGTGLRQLTRGPYDDVMPTYLPDGGIVFCSTRRRGYARCFGAQFSRRWHVYTLHRMDADGGNLRTLSFHDTNEWFPAVSNTGHIVYSRWDYIDRDAVTHQNLWATRPDGTNPVARWGNATPSPHCSFQIQPIPGSSKLVFTASAHHSIAGGSIALVDPTINNDGQQAITRITPEIPFPEAESRDIPQYYAAPWPLSEKYFLVAYSPEPLVWEPGANGRNALGIYVLDALGNRELLYRDPDIGSTNPCPLVSRPAPPILPTPLPRDAPPTGEMVLADVYQGLGEIPRGTIKRLRLIQILPKTTHLANSPPIGLAGEENARAVLGTVPVEPDGSAYFTVPAHKPILFQALDESGVAYQTMRSVTYVQPGERVTCIGCHENRMTAPINRPVMALNRPPSSIEPGPIGGRPLSFVEVVQPVLDTHCVPCHGGRTTQGGVDLTGTPKDGFTRSYCTLCGDRSFWGAGTSAENAAEALVPRFGARNQVQVTPPGGMYGARGSRLINMRRQGHEDVRLRPEDLQRLALWIDCNAVFHGAYGPEDQQRQLRGEKPAMPEVQ